jgi:WD40 repeat protein
MKPYKLLRVSDEGESWILTYNDYLVVVKDGKAVWKVDLWEIFSKDIGVSAVAISRDEKYIATVFNDKWIYFARKENNNLVPLWKFKLIDWVSDTHEPIAISSDNRYICIVGYDWITLLDAQGKLIWENDYRLRTFGSPPYLIDSKLIGIAKSIDNVVLIVNLEGQVIRKISIPMVSPDPIIMDNLIIAVTRINGSEVLRIYNWEGKPIYIFKPKRDDIIAIASSLDGKYIAVSDNALRVYLLERED